MRLLHRLGRAGVHIDAVRGLRNLDVGALGSTLERSDGRILGTRLHGVITALLGDLGVIVRDLALVEAFVDVARRAGIPESVAMMPTPSVVLGTSSPHVIDVANAYATFAAQGVKSKPYLVTQVLGSNKGVLYEATPETQEVFNKDVMADLTYALKGVVTGGTGAAALALGRPAAGKTGTSQSNASAWFSAYTPQIAASVAFFRDNATQSLNGIGGMTSLTGGTFPARIWTQFMKGALKGEPVMEFPAPANIGGLDPVVMTSGGKQKPKP